MTPSVVILVLSCHKPPYDAMYEMQRATWDSIQVPGVMTSYYWCTSFEEMIRKLKLALGAILPLPWDFVFRTNSSSYVDKKRLQEFAAGLPREKCYCGIDTGGFASGSGFFMSRDIAYMLPDLLPDMSEIIEDQLVGNMLELQGIGITPSAQRYDYWAQGEDAAAIKKAYHLRCKNTEANRDDDLLAMKAIHQILQPALL